MITAVGILVAAVLGFAGGLFAIRGIQKFCNVCGCTMRCPDCANR